PCLAAALRASSTLFAYTTLFRSDELLPAAPGAGPRDPQRPAGPQTRRQLAPQRPAPLDVQGLVDGLVRDPHRLVLGEVGREPVRDLFRAPRPAPASVLAASVAPSDPGDLRSRHRDAVRGGAHSCEPVLHILPQPVVGGRLAHLG